MTDTNPTNAPEVLFVCVHNAGRSQIAWSGGVVAWQRWLITKNEEHEGHEEEHCRSR